MSIDNRVSGRTKIVGLIGNPVEHSISPQFQNTLSKIMGVDLIYIPCKVDKNNIEKATEGLRALNLTGFNVTVPFKQLVMRYIDEISDDALLFGAVNTVKNINGKLYGYNTDADGFMRSFKEETSEGFHNKKVALIGAGGAARSIGIKIAMEKASRISIINRTRSKALEIADIINSNFGNIAECCSFEELRNADVIKNYDIIINTTSVGMFPDIEGCPFEIPIKFSENQIIYDIIYNPKKTRLLMEAEKCGCKALNGLGMLLYQGILAFEIWTGLNVTEKAIKQLFNLFKYGSVQQDL